MNRATEKGFSNSRAIILKPDLSSTLKVTSLKLQPHKAHIQYGFCSLNVFWCKF